MNVFQIFYILINLLTGSTAFLTGLFLWRRLTQDYKMLGGFLIFVSLIFYLMGIRATLWGLGLINDIIAFYFFFSQYILIFTFLLPFLMYQLFSLIFKNSIAKKVGLTLGILFLLAFLTTFFIQKSYLEPIYAFYGLVFETTRPIKFFLIALTIIVIPFFIYRIIFLFSEFKKGKILPYRIYCYLAFFFVLISAIPFFIRNAVWHASLGEVGMLAGIFAVYFFASQELIKKEEEI